MNARYASRISRFSIARMKLGFAMGYAPPGTNPTELIELAQEAERLGYDSAWAAEAWGTDAVTVLAWLAATTTKLKIRSPVMQIPGRPPGHNPHTAATPELLHRRGLPVCLPADRAP